MTYCAPNIISEVCDISEGTLDIGWVEAGDRLVPGRPLEDTAPPVLQRDDVATRVAFIRSTLVALVRLEEAEGCATEGKYAVGLKIVQVFCERGQTALYFRPLPVEGFDFIGWWTVLGYVGEQAGLWEDT